MVVEDIIISPDEVDLDWVFRICSVMQEFSLFILLVEQTIILRVIPRFCSWSPVRPVLDYYKLLLSELQYLSIVGIL